MTQKEELEIYKKYENYFFKTRFVMDINRKIWGGVHR